MTVPSILDPFSMYKSLPQAVGFESILDKLNKFATDIGKGVNYPPFNIKKTAENKYVIEMAVAGFGQQDIDIELEGDTLTISGKTKEELDSVGEFLFKGIAGRAFVRQFTLANEMVVSNATMLNGMLKIALERLVESGHVQKIPINTEEKAPLEENPTVGTKPQFLTELEKSL